MPRWVNAALPKAESNSHHAKQNQKRQLDKPYQPEKLGIICSWSRKEKQIGRDYPNKKARYEIQRLFLRCNATGCQIVGHTFCAD
jgi:hypothetical protein